MWVKYGDELLLGNSRMLREAVATGTNHIVDLHETHVHADLGSAPQPGRRRDVVRVALDANSTENRQPIRRRPDSLRNLPTVY